MSSTKEDDDLIPDKLFTIRQVPTTGPQKVSTLIDDTKNMFVKHKRFWIITLLLPLLIIFIYLIATQPNFKAAIVAFFNILWSIVIYISGWIFPYAWIAVVLIFVLYNPVKKLLRKQKISFNEFQGNYEEVLTMREGENEIILYRDRGNFFETLFKGKEKIVIDQDTYLYLKSVGETKTLKVENDEIDILRITIMPKSELPGEELFINRDGIKTLNTKFLLDKADIEEYLLKINLEGVDAELLKNQLFNLTRKLHEKRQQVAQIEQRYHDELEKDFWNYLLTNCPGDETAKKHIRLLYKHLQEDPAADTIPLKEFLKHIPTLVEVDGAENE